jgi:hypothetical protein|tara:strand:+ start:1678 stop:2058 length:381 start_codon:yes stop_codon:yes gene_type:complete
MSYSDPRPYAYSYYHDFGAGSEAMVMRGPSGKQGSVKEVEVEAIETFTNTTTEAIIELGSSAGTAEYVNMGLGTLADGDQQRLTDTAADLVLDALPADTDIHITFNAPTGGTPAGKAHVHMMIEWY